MKYYCIPNSDHSNYAQTHVLAMKSKAIDKRSILLKMIVILIHKDRLDRFADVLVLQINDGWH